MYERPARAPTLIGSVGAFQIGVFKSRLPRTRSGEDSMGEDETVQTGERRVTYKINKDRS
jgi:hypothetical protein